MKNQKKYHGVIVPMVTPVTKTGSIDESSVDRLINFVLNAGGFPFILGTTGEIASNTYENREHLAKHTAAVVNGRKTLYAGITDNSVAKTIETGKKYFDYGVNAFVVHLPFFYPLTEDLMLKYYEKLAEELPAPIIIYNIFSVTHMSIPINVIEKLSAHPNIAGIKDSERDFERIKKLAELFKDEDNFSLFIGWTNKSSEALLMGFDGIVPNTGNIVPDLFHSLYEAASWGNNEEAEKYQAKAELLSNLVQNKKTMARTIPELKTIMNSLGICEPNVLPPLEPLTKSEQEVLTKEYMLLNL